jgi:hypothetical protein
MDLSTLSDAELLAMRERAVRQQIPQQSAADLANMTDGELIALARLGPPTPAPEGAIIHTGRTSYVAGRPDIGVDRTGMPIEDAQRALGALSARAEPSVAGILPRQLMPYFQGFTASAGDEALSAGAGVRSVLGGGDFMPAYDYAQELQRQELQQERTENPVSSTIAQIGGGVTAGALAAPLLPSTLMSGTMFRQALASGGLGAVGGAVEGFMAGSDLPSRMQTARDGLIFGTAAGVSAPFVAGGIRSGVERIANSATTDRMLRGIGLDRPTADMVRRPLDADMIAGAQTALRQAGPDAMLADAGGASRGVVDTAIQRGGQMSSSAMQAIDTRVTNAYESLKQRMDGLLGSPEGILQRQDAIRTGTQGARRNTYDDAYAQSIDYASPAGLRLEAFRERVTPDVISEANRLMRLRGERSQQILIDVADDGSITFREMPDVRQWDYITRGLNRLAQSGENTGALGRRTDMSDALSDLAGEIRTTLRQHIPEYDTALRTAREPIREIQALELGYDALKPSTRRTDFLMELSRRGDDNIDAVKAGMREYIDDTLSNVRTALSNFDVEEFPRARAALMGLTTDAAQSKLRRVLSPEEFAEMNEELNQAARALILKGDVAMNSRTFGRQAADEAADQALAPGIVGSAQRAEPLRAVQRGVQAFFGTRPQDDLARKDALYEGALRFLTQPRGPVGAQQAYDALSDAYRTQGVNALLADNIARVTATGAAGGAYQAAPLLLGTR